jgi:hypothetical protein
MADGLRTLEQSFAFPGLPSAALADALWSRPLVGEDSVFGPRTGCAAEDDDGLRRLRRYSPAPGFVFDVAMRRAEGGRFILRLSQPDRQTPYLQGEIVWRLSDPHSNGEAEAVFDEQINTPAALERVSSPLTGPRPSLRRWLFFKVGHHAAMKSMAHNLARLAAC